jgi:hypothetical protein
MEVYKASRAVPGAPSLRSSFVLEDNNLAVKAEPWIHQCQCKVNNEQTY